MIFLGVFCHIFVTFVKKSLKSVTDIKTKKKITYCDGIGAGWCKPCDGTSRLGGQHEAVLDEGVLRHRGVEITPGNVATNLEKSTIKNTKCKVCAYI